MIQDNADCAMFDLDKTLVSKDSTATWMRTLLHSSVWRLLAALTVLPVALVLLQLPSTRRFGASVLLWIATAGFNETMLKRSIDDFAERFEAGQHNLCWIKDAVRKLADHIAQGHCVVVVTAAPQWLAERLLIRLGSGVRVIGSTLRKVGAGWVADRHCRGEEKCRMLLEAGYGDGWSWAYSDSDDDTPMLARARDAFLVNASSVVERRVAAQGAPHVVVVHWQ